MNILIIENETYLAQSISKRLTENSHHCETQVSSKNIKNDIVYDVVIISTSITDEDINTIIQKFTNSIIILMVSYISNDTVFKPLSLGAQDYVLKPFAMDELVNKINHRIEFKKLTLKNESYDKYLSNAFELTNNEYNHADIKLPLYLSTNFQKNADAFAFTYASIKNEPLYFITLRNKQAIKEIKSIPPMSIVYIIDYQLLKNGSKDAFFEAIKNKNVIISGTSDIDDKELNTLIIKNEDNIFDKESILTIENYIKHIILTYQDELPDIELAQRLGVSRKSLWEKRKKYGIQKRK